MANVVLILFYLLIGALVYAKYRQETFVGGLFSSYQLMTTSSNQFPPASQTTITRYRKQRASKADNNNNNKGDNDDSETSKLAPINLFDGDFFALFECLYLWIGLNLIKCFMQSVRVKLETWRHPQMKMGTKERAPNEAGKSINCDQRAEDMHSSFANCNGHIPLQLMNSIEDHQHHQGYLPASGLNQLKVINSIGQSTISGAGDNLGTNYLTSDNSTLLDNSNNNATSTSLLQSNNSPGMSSVTYHPASVVQSATMQQQQPPAAGFNTSHRLAELYVVDDNQFHQHYGPASSFKTISTPDNGSNLDGNSRRSVQENNFNNNTNQQLASDISLSVSSAATTENPSPCINHQNDDYDMHQKATCRLIGPPSMRLVGQSPHLQQQGQAYMLHTDANCYEQDETRSTNNSRLISSSSSQSLSAHHVQQIYKNNNSQDLHQLQHSAMLSNAPSSATCAIHTLDRKTNKHNNNSNNNGNLNSTTYLPDHKLATGSSSTLRPRQTSLSNHGQKTTFSNVNNNKNS